MTGKVTDLLEAIVQDHQEIRTLLNTVEAAQGSDRFEAFQILADKLKQHEAAEQSVVHPLGPNVDGSDTVTQRLIAEEKNAASLLSRLETMDVRSAAFITEFARLKNDVLAHAQAEEEQEHPRLQQTVPPERLAALAENYLNAKAFFAATDVCGWHTQPNVTRRSGRVQAVCLDRQGTDS